VQFANGAAAIQKSSLGLLNQVVAILRQHPEIKKVRIEGHTDNAGNAAKNLKLSEARAAAVAAHLIKQGIAKDRLVAKGLGSTRPIVANDTPAHREQNRRVELHIE
jgi:outer membrane protein OmpA-like peptidoglycan-associated protein